MNAGLFIALEGMDGTGKSTLVAALAQRLDAVTLRTPAAALASMRPALDACFAPSPVATQLFYAATVVLASEQARAARDAGRVVLIDRYWASTLAYAACRASSADLAAITPKLLVPDLTLYLTVDEDVRAARLAERAMTDADAASLAQREILRRAYDAALDAFPGRRLERVDTSRRNAETCASDVCTLVRSMERKAA